MDFYQNYVRLCNSVKKSPSAVALEIGIEKSTVTRWGNGSTPNKATRIKIADYFGISVSDLMSGNFEQKEKPATVSGDELRLTDQEKAFILWLRSLPAEKKQAVLNFQDMF